MRSTGLLLLLTCHSLEAFAPSTVPAATHPRLDMSSSIMLRLSQEEEASFVRSIKACKTSSQVQFVLDDTETAVTANVAAAAMRTMVKFDGKSQTTSKALPNLLRIAGEGVVAHYKNPLESNMTIFSLQDVLYSISLLRKGGMVPMANVICKILTGDLLFMFDKLQPRRCVEIMEASNALQLHHPVLLEAIATRLSKSDALGKLTPPKLVEALRAGTQDTALGFLRRLCKQAVRRELGPQHLAMAIDAAGRFVGSEIEEEARRMAFSLVTRELSRPMGGDAVMIDLLTPKQAATILSAMSRFEWDTLSDRIEDLCNVIELKINKVTPEDTALVLQSFLGLQVNNFDLVERLASRTQTWVEEGQNLNSRTLSTILTFTYRLCGKDEIPALEAYADLLKYALSRDDSIRGAMLAPDVAAYVWFLCESGQDRDPNVATVLGNRLLSLAPESVRPGTLVMTVRYAVKLYAREHPDALQPYIQATSAACTRSEFLLGIESVDLAFLIEALAIAKCDDERLLLLLAEAVTRPDIVDDFSPSSSRRILTSFTTISNRLPNNEELQLCLARMFEMLGGNLLSTQLKPYEAAEAVYSYPKAGYLADMGVFDHLNGLVSDNLPEYSTRTLSQCLWACAKMYSWEPDQSLEAMTPPYVNSAMKYTQHLASRKSELSPIDLAQCCWAIGRMRISDPIAMKAFANRALDIIKDCHARETSNIIWGLSKTGYDNKSDMISISKRMLDPDIKPLAQEAACVLYALGNAEIREDKVFEHLTEVLISQSGDVSAQAMANALWAHNVVGKLPPSMLLRSWAYDKFGLVGVVEPLDPALLEL